MRFLRIIFFWFFFALSACSNSYHANKHLSWSRAMQKVMREYSAHAELNFAHDYDRVGVEYPGKKLAFLIFKEPKLFLIYVKSNHQWKYLRTYKILAASGTIGPKLKSGDDQVPEGIYKIIGLNPESHFDLSLHLNYPNAYDLAQAKIDNRHNLGSNIFIHGDDKSVGCIALGNASIQQIFPLVDTIGFNNVEVIIAPEDFRIKPIRYNLQDPLWVTDLYKKISSKLRQFPLPRA